MEVVGVIFMTINHFLAIAHSRHSRTVHSPSLDGLSLHING